MLRLHATVALDASSYTLRPPDGKRITKLVVQPLTATVYVAPPTPATFDVTATSGTGSDVYISPTASGANAIHAGLKVEAAQGVPADTYVVSYANGHLVLSAELSENIANEVLTFSSPAANNGTGLALLHTTVPTVFDCEFSSGVTVYSAAANSVTILWDFE